MIITSTVADGKLDPGIKTDGTSIVEVKAREGFGLMKTTIESMKQMDAKSKTVPLDLSKLHDHSSFVKWKDAGAPGDWQTEWPERGSLTA